MDWNLEGKRVFGYYLDEYPVTGVVKESRVKYGGKISHTVELDKIMFIHGSVRTTVLLEECEVITDNPDIIANLVSNNV